ncbi:S1 family peptidase [Methylobacterium nigriterrae]|uniref:S1 family peptidase n=1 Tax=Methylobacterium nigriterrae TaxID=3127512 RepID=UPI003013B2B4
MGSPWQVRRKLCAIGLALIPVLCSLHAAPATAAPHESARACIDPAASARAVVSIFWRYDEPRRDGWQEIIGERATAWFYTSPRLLVTAAHFANELPTDGWQEAELRQAVHAGEAEVTARVRFRVAVRGRLPGPSRDRAGLAAGLAEDVAIIELQEPFLHATVLDIQPKPLAADATVLVLGYPGGRMEAAQGIVRGRGELADRYAGLALFEVQGANRLLLDGGASGAPVLDCGQGRVVAVLNGLLTGPSLPFLPPDRVIPTPWGSPTNTAVPASTLAAMRNCIP